MMDDLRQTRFSATISYSLISHWLLFSNTILHLPFNSFLSFFLSLGLGPSVSLHVLSHKGRPLFKTIFVISSELVKNELPNAN